MSSPADGRTRLREASVMDLDRIVADPEQPRQHFDSEAISRLAQSLKTHGQLQPIRIRWNDAIGKWIVISGERRYRAAVLAGLTTIQCICLESEPDPAHRLAEQMIENCLREDLSPIEQARAYDRLMKMRDWTARQLSDELHVSPSSITRALSLLNLPPDLRNQVDDGTIPASAGYELARVSDPDAQQTLAGQIANKELTRDQIAEAARASKRKNQPAKSPAPTFDPTADDLDSPPNFTAQPHADQAHDPSVSIKEFRLGKTATVVVRISKANASDADYVQLLENLVTALKQPTSNSKRIS